MTQDYLWLFIAIFAGAVIPFQGVLNANLAQGLGHPIASSLVSFGVGFSALVILSVWLRVVPSLSLLKQQPFINFLGGFGGVMFVTAVVFLIPRIGAASVVGATFFGQIICAIFVDHYGIWGLNVQPISWQRVVGVLLMLVGLIFTRM